MPSTRSQNSATRKLEVNAVTIDMAEKQAVEILKRELEAQMAEREAERAAFNHQLEAMRQEFNKQCEEMRRLQERERNARNQINAERQQPSTNHVEENSQTDLAKALMALTGVLSAQSQSVRMQSISEQQQTALQCLPSFNLPGAVRNFYGTESPEQAQAWITELENLKNINEWSDPVAFSIGKAHLKDSALKWLMSNVCAIKDFNSLKILFKATFTYKESRSEKLRRMAARTQRAQESTQVYFLDKVWLCQGLDLSVNEIRDEVAAGLWSREMANYALGRDYESTEAILQDLVRFERIDMDRRGRIAIKGSPNGQVNHEPSSTGGAVQVRGSSSGAEGQPKTSTAYKGGIVNERLCFKCHKSGHMAKECTSVRKEITCFICKRPGHIASRCNKQNGPTIEEVKTVNDLSGEETGAKFIREVRVGEIPLKAHIDMGASVCTIKATIVLREGFHMVKGRSRLEGFGSNFVESPGVINELVALENLKPRKIQFRIVPDTAQVYDIILGRPFTEAEHVSYSRVGPELTFMDIDPSALDGRNNAKERVTALQSVNLEPGEINFIKVATNLGPIDMPFENKGERRRRIIAGEHIGEAIYSVEKLPVIENRKTQ